MADNKRVAVFAVSTSAHRAGGMEAHLDYLLSVLEEKGYHGELFTTALPSGRAPSAWKSFRASYLEGTVPAVHGRAWWRQSRLAFERSHAENPFGAVISEACSASAVVKIPGPGRPPVVFWTQGFEPDHIANIRRDLDSLSDVLKYPVVKVPEALFFSWLERDFSRRSDLVVAVAGHITEKYRRFYGVKEERLRVLYNWVDTDFFKPDESDRELFRARNGWKKDSPVVLMAAVLAKQKGIQEGLRALVKCRKYFPELRIAVAGDGWYSGALKKMAESMGLESVVSWLGEVSQAHMPDVYRSADIFLMPTLRVEGMSYTMLEAMSCNLAIAASDMGGNRETLADTGIIVPAGETDALEGALRGLLGNPALREELGRKARKRAETMFDRRTAGFEISGMLEKLHA